MSTTPPAPPPGEKWEFRKLHQSTKNYKDGTVLPHLEVDVYVRGQKVGFAEIHLHKHKGGDGFWDVSFGFTGVVDTARVSKVLGGLDAAK